jgi:hypothetical protein
MGHVMTDRVRYNHGKQYTKTGKNMGAVKGASSRRLDTDPYIKNPMATKAIAWKFTPVPPFSIAPLPVCFVCYRRPILY